MLKIVCYKNDVKQKVQDLLDNAKHSQELFIDDLELIDEILFNTDLDVEITLGNGKIVNKEQAKEMRAECGFDLR